MLLKRDVSLYSSKAINIRKKIIFLNLISNNLIIRYMLPNIYKYLNMISEEATLNNTILFLKNANIFMKLKNIRFV